MKTTIITTAICCALFSITSCNQHKAITENAITFDSIKIDRSKHLFNDEQKPACKLSINFVYPTTYENQETLNTMQEIFLLSVIGKGFSLPVQQALDNYIDKYISGYKALEKEYKKDMGVSMYTYEQILSTTLEYNKGGIVSFLASAWNYTGGAHGLDTLKGYIIDINTGKLVNEKNVFKAGSEKALSTLIVKYLMLNYNVTSPEALQQEAGFFNVNESSPNGNIMANEEGITYIYNPYEIAPYVVGAIKVLLPYAEIRDYIQKNSPLYIFVK